MEINDRLKRVIFKRLAVHLSHVEIIPYEDSIWFIDRNDKYWYLELRTDGYLWWRYDFFDQFFQAFSLERNDYELLIKEWVEQVLNHKVITTIAVRRDVRFLVEQVLNNKVITTIPMLNSIFSKVEEVLNSK